MSKNQTPAIKENDNNSEIIVPFELSQQVKNFKQDIKWLQETQEILFLSACQLLDLDGESERGMILFDYLFNDGEDYCSDTVRFETKKESDKRTKIESKKNLKQTEKRVLDFLSKRDKVAVNKSPKSSKS